MTALSDRVPECHRTMSPVRGSVWIWRNSRRGGCERSVWRLTGHHGPHWLQAIEIVREPVDGGLTYRRSAEEALESAPRANDLSADPVVRRVPSLLLRGHPSIMIYRDVSRVRERRFGFALPAPEQRRRAGHPPAR